MRDRDHFVLTDFFRFTRAFDRLRDAATLGAISTAFLSALVPQIAAADLFNRALALQFGAGTSRHQRAQAGTRMTSPTENSTGRALPKSCMRTLMRSCGA